MKLLPRRIHAISTALDAGEPEAAQVALVSLAVSASMVGALQLERDARLLEEDVRTDHTDRARESVRTLVNDADAVAAALVEALGGG